MIGTIGAAVLFLGAAPRADPGRDIIAYARLVARYQGGDDGVLQEVADWDPRSVANAMNEVEHAERTGFVSGPGPVTVRREFPAAVMMHTEAGLALNWRGDGAGAFREWKDASRLAALPAETDAQARFLRAWYAALGHFFIGSYYSADALPFLERGAARFPEDVEIAMARAELYEARGTDTSGLTREERADLTMAESLYREILGRENAPVEARLRLGRVLVLTGPSDRALVELEAVSASKPPDRTTYLSHLFAGDILRRASRLSEAEQEFGLAVDRWPAGQAAGLGRAEILHLLGDRTGAAGAVRKATAGGGLGTDPYRTYTFGDRDDQRQALEAVKAMVRIRTSR
ncbi:MAG TPA: hypothetical protein VGQ33_18190 [Vicinamibacteria bacterium]|nr:hypothetical protein [Vicinamibacteria bacterium]